MSIINLRYGLKSHPVQRVRAERVAGLLPVGVAFGLEANLANGEDVALLLSFTVTHLQKRISTIFYATQNCQIKDQRHAAVKIKRPDMAEAA